MKARMSDLTAIFFAVFGSHRCAAEADASCERNSHHERVRKEQPKSQARGKLEGCSHGDEARGCLMICDGLVLTVGSCWVWLLLQFREAICFLVDAVGIEPTTCRLTARILRCSASWRDRSGRPSALTSSAHVS